MELPLKYVGTKRPSGRSYTTNLFDGSFVAIFIPMLRSMAGMRPPRTAGSLDAMNTSSPDFCVGEGARV